MIKVFLNRFRIIFLTIILFVPFVFILSNEKKQKAFIKVNYYHINGKESLLKVHVYVKEGRKKKPVKQVLLNLYLNEISKEGMMGSIATDENGDGVFTLVNKFNNAIDTLQKFTFIVRLREDLLFEDTEKKLTINYAYLKVSVLQADSSRKISFSLMEKNEIGNMSPVAEEQIKVFIKRYYSLLPIGGDYIYTNEQGEAEMLFPEGIVGNENGNVQIIAKVEEHDTYGNLEADLSVNWGHPVIYSDATQIRELWATGANAPIYLVFTVSGIIIIVWSVIIFALRMIYIINKQGKQQLNSSNLKLSNYED